MVVKKKYIPVQIMTAFSNNIDYISPWGPQAGGRNILPDAKWSAIYSSQGG